MSQTGVSAAFESSRHEKIVVMLRDSFGRLSGLDPAEIDIHTTFLELGADSLFLLQISQRIQDNFGVNLPFRQLMEKVSTVDAVAAYIDSNLEPGALEEAEAVTQAPVESPLEQALLEQPAREQTPPAYTPTAVQPAQSLTMTPPVEQTRAPQRESMAGIESAWERIVAQQLQVMTRQLEFLRGELHPVNISAPPTSQTQPPIQTQIAALPPAVPAPAVAPARDTHTPPSTPTLPPAASQQTSSVAIEPEPFLPHRPIQRDSATGLNPRQQRSLEDLIARVVKRTQKSKQLAEAARPVLADNRATAGFRLLFKEMFYPLVIERGEGAKVWDVDGNEYVDLTMGFGALLFGHSPPFIIEALQEQLQRGIQLGGQSPLVGEAATMVCELTGVERVAFCNSGTEAVMGALRLARAVTGRERIAMFDNSYHGSFDGTLVRSSDERARGLLRAIPLAPGISQRMIDDVLLLNYGTPETIAALREHAHELAAVIIEPPRSRRPDVQPLEFLRELRKLTAETGVALIFDEVVTGFRFHSGGAQAIFGIEADLVAYGKAMGGGVPIGVVAGKAAYMDAIDGGMWHFGDASYPEVRTTYYAGTYFKNPMVMAAASAALNHIKQSGPQLYEGLERHTARIVDTLNAFFEAEQVPMRIISSGSLFRFVFHRNLNFRELFYYYMLERGVYICETRSCFLSTAHTEADVDQIIKAVQESVAAMREAGFLLGSTSPDSPNGGGPSGGQRTAGEARARAAPATGVASAAADTSTPHTSQALRRVPLTEGQKQLWVLARMGDDVSIAYNLSITLRLHGPLRVTALRRALQQVVDRHEALRTTFSPDGDYQQFAPAMTLAMPLVDLSNTAQETREAAVKTWLETEARRPFNFVTGPLLRAHVVKIEEQQHLLVLSVHHIISDAWSLGILLREVKALYAAECNGDDINLPEPMPFSEYAEWQTRLQQGAEMTRSEAYWLEQYSPAPLPLELPTDRVRPPSQTFNGACLFVSMRPALYRELERSSARLHCTTLQILLAGFKVLLHRLSGQHDIVVGVPSAGQVAMKGRTLVGYCINLLPLRTQARDDLTFVDYLRDVKRVLLDSYDHQHYPVNQLIKKLNMPRDPSRSPLITVLFNLDHASPNTNFFGLEEQGALNPTNTAQFDIDLNITEIHGEATMECEFNTDLFDEQTIQRWLGYYQNLLEAVITDPQQKLADLQLFDEAERQVIREFNATATEFPGGFSYQQQFEAQVRRTPAAVALSDDREQLSYAELNRRANRLAHYLRGRGVGPETVVAVLLERSAALVVSLLAVSKAGAVYLPLDPQSPGARLAPMLRQTGALLVITESSLRPLLPEGTLALCLDEAADTLSGAEAAELAPLWSAAQLAYIIYTSGSTGVPKGAMVEERGMLNHLWLKVRELGLGEEDVVAQTAPQGFDISVWQMLAGLLVGARVHVFADEVTHDATRLLGAVGRAGVTILEVVPSLLAGMLEAISAEDGGGAPALSLRYLVVTGEALGTELCRRWLAQYPQVPVVNAYGPTECSDDVTHEVVGEASVAAGPGVVALGRALANLQLYVVESGWRLAPLGVAGELWVGGVGVGRGYVGDAGRTAAVFVPDGWGAEPGGRLYRTGDVGRYLADGRLEFLGRADGQVKVRGHRIETGEIEATLLGHEWVREAAVVLRGGEGEQAGRERLVAYVVGRAGAGEVSVTELRRYLSERLPEYMLPASFVTLRQLPLTANGKLDRRALPAPGEGRPALADAYLAPGTTIERALAAAWEEVLEVERVGVRDNFFELGGDSILSIQVIARAGRRGVRLTPRQLFQHQTIAELAAVLAEESTEAGAAPAAASESGAAGEAKTGEVPLTPIQHWFFEQEFAAAHHWNQAALLRLRRALEPALLEQAVAAVIGQHEALRLRFWREEATGQWRQRLVRPEQAPAGVEVVDLRGLEEETVRQRLAAGVEKAQVSLDFERGPLLRVVYFAMDEEAQGETVARLVGGRVLVVIHHLAIDVVSWQPLLEDLQSAYEQLAQGRAPASLVLPPRTTTFKRWAEALTVYAQSAAVREELPYWTAAERQQVPPLPLDYAAAGEDRKGSEQVVYVGLSQEETRALTRAVPRRFGTLINDVLLAALGRSYRRWSGARRLLVDVEGHGREEWGAEEGAALAVTRTVGWFTTIAPLLLEVGDETEAAESELRRVAGQVRALRRGGLGYGLLRYLSADEAVRAQLARQPAAAVSFNYMGRGGGGGEEGSWFAAAAESAGEHQSAAGRRPYLVEINGGVVAGELRLAWSYSPQRHRRERIEDWANEFLQALREFIALAHHSAPLQAELTSRPPQVEFTSQSSQDELTWADFQTPDLSQRDLDELLAELSATEE